MCKFVEVFPNSDQCEMWLDSGRSTSLSNILVTIVSSKGESTKLISNGKFFDLDQTDLVEPTTQPATETKANYFRFLGKIMTFAGYTFALLLLVFSLFSFTGIVKARIVLTGSMAPAINTGDIIFTTPISRKEPKIGDVIAYEAKRFNGESVAVFSHRIVGGDINTGFIVKGDSNKSPDTQKPKRSDILGVVIFVVPFIGNLLTPKALFLLVPSLFGFWLILDAMKNVE
jgi:signal peptidase I